MNTHKSLYGYLNASLYCGGKKSYDKLDVYSDPLGCFESSPEEILFKAHWENYFDNKV